MSVRPPRRARPARSRARRPRPLGPGDLVLAASVVTGLDADRVLDDADVEVLVAIAARARAAATVELAASEVLVGVAASRPFARANGATAWLAAMQLLDEHRLDVDIDDREATALVHDAAAGRVVETEVAERLAVMVTRQPGPWRRRGRRVTAAVLLPRSTTSEPLVHPCPVCGRAVGDARWPFTPGIPAASFEIVAVCARQHGTHDARGRSRSRGPNRRPTRWCPLVFGSDDGGGAPFVAITDRGPVAFRPSPAGVDGAQDDRRERPSCDLEVVVLDELVASDLIGSWEPLWARGAVVGRLPGDACILDDSGTFLDWHRVIEGVDAPELLVPA